MARPVLLERPAAQRASERWREAELLALAGASHAVADFLAAAHRLDELAGLQVLPEGVRCALRQAARTGQLEALTAAALTARASSAAILPPPAEQAAS